MPAPFRAKWSPRVLAMLAFVVGLGLIAGQTARLAHAQFHCSAATLPPCPDCNSTFAPTLGCTAAPPSTWAVGMCIPGGLSCQF